MSNSEENIIKMEIGQQGESVEDSILKNLSETRDLWKSQESNQNTKMLQPKSKQYDQIKVEDVGSSSETESESESEAIVPSVKNMKNKWEIETKDSPVKNQVLPITVPVIRKKEEIVMRNRFHKEPVDPNNIIRPDQAGTKENPDYVVNIQAMKSQFASGVAPKPTRPITEPLPNKPVIHTTSLSRVQSAPIKLDNVIKSTAGEREEPVKPSGGLAAVRAQWETQMAETSRGRSRSRRPDQINLKEEARTVKIREKSVARESRRARRAASAGRTLTNGNGMRVYDSRRSRSKSPPVNQSEARDSNRGRSERVSRDGERKKKEKEEKPQIPQQTTAPPSQPQLPQQQQPQQQQQKSQPTAPPRTPPRTPTSQTKPVVDIPIQPTAEPAKPISQPASQPASQPKSPPKSPREEITQQPSLPSRAPKTPPSEQPKTPTQPSLDDFDLLAGPPPTTQPSEVKIEQDDFDLLAGPPSAPIQDASPVVAPEPKVSAPSATLSPSEQPTQEKVPTPVKSAPVETKNEMNLFDDFNIQSEPTQVNNQSEVPTTNGGANLLDEFDLLGGGGESLTSPKVTNGNDDDSFDLLGGFGQSSTVPQTSSSDLNLI